ncbi:hypothetical protein FQA39_LY01803 [Lamprigera yunnana]|nr:hypothetical protein FQA39_LY01803 [Lamprigera yunnana]
MHKLVFLFAVVYVAAAAEPAAELSKEPEKAAFPLSSYKPLSTSVPYNKGGYVDPYYGHYPYQYQHGHGYYPQNRGYTGYPYQQGHYPSQYDYSGVGYPYYSGHLANSKTAPVSPFAHYSGSPNAYFGAGYHTPYTFPGNSFYPGFADPAGPSSTLKP